jgi:hypothetical protein
MATPRRRGLHFAASGQTPGRGYRLTNLIDISFNFRRQIKEYSAEKAHFFSAAACLFAGIEFEAQVIT